MQGSVGNHLLNRKRKLLLQYLIQRKTFLGKRPEPDHRKEPYCDTKNCWVPPVKVSVRVNAFLLMEIFMMQVTKKNHWFSLLSEKRLFEYDNEHNWFRSSLTSASPPRNTPLWASNTAGPTLELVSIN